MNLSDNLVLVLNLPLYDSVLSPFCILKALFELVLILIDLLEASTVLLLVFARYLFSQLSQLLVY